MLDHKQFREHIVRPALRILEPEIPYSKTAENLLIGTAVQESALRFVVQLGGPALGVFQMEPMTHDDIWQNFLAARPTLAARLSERQPEAHGRLVYDLRYAAQMARVHYWRVPEALPANYPEALGRYYKRYFNTELGKATVAQFVQNYEAIA